MSGSAKSSQAVLLYIGIFDFIITLKMVLVENFDRIDMPCLPICG